MDHPSAIPSRTHAARVALALVALGALAVGCGEETGPDVESLGAREILGLEVDHVAAMSVDDRAALVATLETAWPEEAGTSGVEHLVELEVALDPTTATLADHLKAHIGALDAQRAAAGLEPLPLVALDVDQHLAVELLDTPSALLEATDDGLWQVRDELDLDGRRWDGDLVWDDQWPAIERRALGDASEREAVESLEPLLRAVLTHAPDDGSVRVVPAPRAPLLVWYAPATRTVLVNPTLLYLMEHDGADRVRRQSSAARAVADASPAADAGADDNQEPDLPGGVDPPPAVDGMQDGGGSGLTDCDCGEGIEDSCNDALEEVMIVTGLILLGAALFAGVLLLIVFLV